MEKTAAEKIQVGLLVIVGLTLFVLAIYFVGNREKMFGRTEHITAVFSNTSGLQLGNTVRFAGVNIGTVKAIEMVNDSSIIVDLLIDKPMLQHIRKDAIASIGSDGLVGSMVVNISPGEGKLATIEAGDQLQSVRRVSTDDILKTLNVTNKNAALLTQDLVMISKQMAKGKGTVATLLNDSLMAADLKMALHYLRKSSKGASEIIENLNSTLRNLENKNSAIGVMSNPESGHKIRTILSNLEQSSIEINRVLENSNATILNIKNGNGAINYLSNDPALVRKIDSTVTNLQKATLLLNEELEALKHSFLLRGYYKKQQKPK